MKDTIVCGIQQVGVGVFDVVEAYNWYIRAFGCDVKVVDDLGVAERMLPYTGGRPRPRRAILAVNMKGGGGFEVWEPKDNNISPPAERACLGDKGIAVCKLKTSDVEKAYAALSAMQGARILTGIMDSPYGPRHFYVEDPYQNIFELVEDTYVFCDLKDYPVGGTHGVCIGVTDMDRSIAYYATLTGYDKVIYDGTGEFGDLKSLPGGEGRFRRVVITSSKAPEGPLSGLYGTGCIELLQAYDRVPKKIFEGRMWGDPGFIQICFDVRNMEGMRDRIRSLGSDFVCDSGTDFKMEAADGRFTYVEDPDGTLIELVETFRIPILKKWGIFLDLARRDSHRQLPRLITRALSFMRVKKIS